MVRGRWWWTALCLGVSLSLWAKPHAAPDHLLRRYDQLRREGNQPAAEALWRYLEHHHGDDVAVLVGLARQAMHSGHWDYALALLAQAIRLDGTCVAARMARAELYRRLNRISEAMQDLETALRQAPQHELAERMLGLLRLMQGQWDAAIVHLTRYLNHTDAQDADVYYWRGLARLRSGRLADAETDFARASELAPEFSEIALHRAQALESQGKLAEAAQAYARYLAGNPQDVEARLAYAKLLQRLSRPTDALNQLQAVLQLQPSRREVLHQVYQTARQMRQYYAALNALDLLLHYEQDNTDLWFQKALLLEEMYRYREALTALAECEKRAEARARPIVPLFFAARGNLYRKLGELEKALDALDQALKLNPQYPYAQYVRADVYWRMGKIEAALAELDAAAQNNADFVHIYIKRAEILRVRGQWQEALKQLDHAVQLAPKVTFAALQRGGMLIASGRYEEAAKEFARVTQREGEHPSSFVYAQILLAAVQDRWDEAERLAETALVELPADALSTYNLACAWALMAHIRLGQRGFNGKDAQVLWYKQRALDLLEKTYQLGYNDRWHTVHDADFLCLHREARFWQIVGKERPFTEP
ncbi:MAG: tetratricopeptide repeat protein [Gemmatales bacterium]|nr:tetratricopeptide repeat protein [Gemmatales bacterium]MDW8174481.1 tetratricopeptide repeat protein [Gemmatales bacterium]